MILLLPVLYFLSAMPALQLIRSLDQRDQSEAMPVWLQIYGPAIKCANRSPALAAIWKWEVQAMTSLTGLPEVEFVF